MAKLAPSILSADFARLGEQVRLVEDAGADYIHIDIMDGHFVPNLSMGFPVIQSIRSCTELVFDMHLMVEEPDRFLSFAKEAGADIICVHAEACRHLHRTLDSIRSLGCRAAVALNPYTPLELVRYALPDVEMVLQMTVDPGFGGAKCIPSMTEKIRALREMIRESGREIDIEVDGGMGTDNVRAFLESGANVIVAGSSIFRGNAAENVRRFKEILDDF